MNDLSIVSHIKNDIEFLEQFWKHIHSYSPKEIIIIDTGSVDGTYDKLLSLAREPKITYRIEQSPHYLGQVYSFNKVIMMANSKWVMKIDTDELYRRQTVDKILNAINANEYNCINIPTLHHFINSSLIFDCLDINPDFHQRIFRKDVWGFNAADHSRNHGSIRWSKELKMLELGFDDAMYHYSFLKPFPKIQKRSIVNYFIDIKKVTDDKVLKEVELFPDNYIKLFYETETIVTPAWQIGETPIPFNKLQEYYESEFIKWGKLSPYPLPEDLIVHKIADWPNEKEIIHKILYENKHTAVPL